MLRATGYGVLRMRRVVVVRAQISATTRALWTVGGNTAEKTNIPAVGNVYDEQAALASIPSPTTDYHLQPSANDVTIKDAAGNDITRVKKQPLTLVEEVPVPMRLLSDIELLMTAWCEEHARQYALLIFFVRIVIFLLLTVIVYVFYRTQISAERTLRGVKHMPENLRIGNVVYFDVSENGLDLGRIVIGLLTEQCPLYCEYFHRRCTGSGGNGDSFRGMKLAALIPRHAAIFGDGHEMTHDVPGFDPHFLPTEYIPSGSFRGALSSIATGPSKESPNFVIHLSSGDYAPQIFGLIVGGYDVMERISSNGVKHGNTPKREYVIENCGELCTLDKSHILPMPWKLYHNVSSGLDEDKFGPRADPSLLLPVAPAAATAVSLAPAAGGKPWWRFW